MCKFFIAFSHTHLNDNDPILNDVMLELLKTIKKTKTKTKKPCICTFANTKGSEYIAEFHLIENGLMIETKSKSG